MNGTIQFVDDHSGEVKTYRRYSARLPEFNEKFGPGTGYRVESTVCALSDLQTARMAAMTEAVSQKLKPEEFGLGALSTMMVCTHRLLDSEGHVVCDARAAAHVQAYKDLELLETASHQRLMAKVGFGGEIFDEDEDRDIAAVAEQREAASPSAQPAPSPGQANGKAKRSPAPKAEPVPSAAPQPAPEAAAVTAEATQAQPAAPEPSQAAPDRSPAQPRGERAAPPAMIRQLAQLAARVGETPPEVASFAEAKAELKRLSTLASAAGAS